MAKATKAEFYGEGVADAKAGKPCKMFNADCWQSRAYLQGYGDEKLVQAGNESRIDECPASGQGCAYGPHGPDGGMQCAYCGSPELVCDAVSADFSKLEERIAASGCTSLVGFDFSGVGNGLPFGATTGRKPYRNDDNALIAALALPNPTVAHILQLSAEQGKAEREGDTKRAKRIADRIHRLERKHVRHFMAKQAAIAVEQAKRARVLP